MKGAEQMNCKGCAYEHDGKAKGSGECVGCQGLGGEDVTSIPPEAVASFGWNPEKLHCSRLGCIVESPSSATECSCGAKLVRRAS